jgi:hypothetical protein
MPQVLTHDVWMYRDPTLAKSLSKEELVGYEVESIDGSIGKIDDASFETDTGHIVVDTGPWIFGKKVVLPAGTIDRIDPDEERVYVNRTKDQIKDAPQLDKEMLIDARHRDEVAGYYGPGGAGYREDNRRN